MPRIHCPIPLTGGAVIDLPSGAARHVQVLRLQPGNAITLFTGDGGEWSATVERMGRSEVSARVETYQAIEREAPREVQLALGMPAGDRMDWLVEKATELGVTRIQPLMTERSVLRVQGERADRKLAHWQAIAVAACEQCGRNRVPLIEPPCTWAAWLTRAALPSAALVLSLQPGSRPVVPAAGDGPVLLLSGPEGGLSPEEESAALARGFRPVTLGTRTLRAETAPLAALAALTLSP
jgi:16S rRNA (uracil1498-N3)-methyltransferase